MLKLGSYLLIFLLLISFTSASFISLTTQITVNSSSPENINVILNIANNGDEPANAIQPSIEFNGNPFPGETIGSLEPKSSHSWNIPIKTETTTPGRYPLILKTVYYDINNYAFSSISPSYVTIQEETAPAVFGKLSNIEMIDNGKLNMEIINLDDKQKNVKVKLYLPRELTTDKETLEITMPSKSKKELEFNIERFSALPKSNYAVAAILEYEENNKHYTNILRGSIKLIEESPSIRSPVTIMITAIIIIIFIISILFLEKRRRKRGIHNESPN